MKDTKIVVFIGIIILMLTACNCDNKNKQYNSLFRKNHPLAFASFDTQDFSQLLKAEKDSQKVRLLNNFYQYFWEGNDLWGEFLVAQGNTILIERYRGFSNYSDSARINKNTPMHLASISKNLTAMVILKLVEKKKIQLNDPVKQYLDKFPYPDITIFDLLTHRSGLGNYDYYAEEFKYIGDDQPEFNNQRMYEMYYECEPSLIFKPGTQHSYCNANYAFLALIIENVSKLAYPIAMHQLLFAPLKMDATYVFQKQDEDTATLSYHYNKRPWKWDPFDYIYGDKNIYSTVDDLFKYSQAMFTDKFLPKALLDSSMQGYSYEKDGIKNYGFGFRLREFENGKKVIFHTGKWHGNNTLFMHLPDEQLTIISLGNKTNRANYAAFSLVSMFGDYPLELDSEVELLAMNNEADQNKMDSIRNSTIPEKPTITPTINRPVQKPIKHDTVKKRPTKKSPSHLLDSLIFISSPKKKDTVKRHKSGF